MTDAAKPRGKSNVTKLINLAIASKSEFFRSPEGELYATVPIGDTRETLLLTDRPFKNWLAQAYFKSTKSGVGGGAVADAVMALSGSAYASGRVAPVYTRVAAFHSRVYLDLCREDRHVVAITPDGWSVGPAPEDVRFIRRSGALPLPVPTRGGGLQALLPKVINVSGDSLTLLIGWLIGCLRGLKPFPILVITGEHGTGKTGACRSARQTIDPSQANLSLTPKEPRDLVIAARNSHVLGFDNLSFIPDWLSDALCMIATGSGFRTRTLTTDSTETIFSSANPIVLNSIADIVRRGDLMDRAITISLELIPEDKRRTEAAVDAAFRKVHPAILGALADAVAQALREPVVLTSMPRMADFATTVESAAPALGWEPGEFLRAYAENRATAAEAMIDGDLVVDALKSLRSEANADGVWAGTSTELRDAIVRLTPEVKQKDLPKTPQSLIGRLRRLAPTLRGFGIQIDGPKVVRVSDTETGRRLSVGYAGPRCLDFPKDSEARDDSGMPETWDDPRWAGRIPGEM